MRDPEPGKYFLVESGIMGFGIRNTDQGIRNPTKDWNPSSTDKDWNPGQFLQFGVHSVESRIQDYLGFPYMGRLYTEITMLSRIRRLLSLSWLYSYYVRTVRSTVDLQFKKASRQYQDPKPRFKQQWIWGMFRARIKTSTFIIVER